MPTFGTVTTSGTDGPESDAGGVPAALFVEPSLPQAAQAMPMQAARSGPVDFREIMFE
jgi:hypothetical protein